MSSECGQRTVQMLAVALTVTPQGSIPNPHRRITVAVWLMSSSKIEADARLIQHTLDSGHNVYHINLISLYFGVIQLRVEM